MDKAQEYDSFSDWYDLVCKRSEDLQFYIDLAERYGSPILELGCGTGRVACELAKKGYEVLGIDISPKMIQRAQIRKAALSSDLGQLVKFQQESMVNFVLPQRFGLIIAPYSAILELSGAEDRTSTYQCCINHLNDSGALIVDNWFQGVGAFADWGKPRPEKLLMFLGVHEHPTEPDINVHHFETQDLGPDGQMILTVILDLVSVEGAVRRQAFRLVRHYVSPDLTETELTETGFRNIEIYGGYNREPIYDPSLRGRGRQIFVAKK